MPAAETTTVAVTGALAAALPAAAASWPPGIVVAAALIGGLVSVWLEMQEQIVISLRWLVGVAMHILVSASAGVAGSAIAMAVLPDYALTAPLAKAPQWAIAGCIAALIFKVGPLAWDRARKLAGAPAKDEGGGNA